MKVGDYLYDEIENVYGIIKDIDENLHNVYVVYDENDGSGLYCLNPECEEYEGDFVKIIEKNK